MLVFALNVANITVLQGNIFIVYAPSQKYAISYLQGMAKAFVIYTVTAL